MAPTNVGANLLKDGESKIADYFTLLKPRVMSLVVFTGLIGLLLAPGHIHPFIACLAIFCIALGSGAAGAINMWYESDIDAKMERTKNRPIPAGRIESDSAIEFASVAAFASVFIMSVGVNFIAGALLLAAILFYVFIYTVLLKRRTPQNIVIGGAAGAFPPMIGWAAVTGDISIESIILFSLIFIWTPPHFWALALYKCKDYEKAGIPMMPVVAGQLSTRKQIFVYSLLLFAVSLVPFFIGMSGYVYFASAIILGAKFVKDAFSLYREYSEGKSRNLFKYSILYLFLIFVLLIVDKMVLS